MVICCVCGYEYNGFSQACSRKCVNEMIHGPWFQDSKHTWPPQTPRTLQQLDLNVTLLPLVEQPTPHVEELLETLLPRNGPFVVHSRDGNFDDKYVAMVDDLVQLLAEEYRRGDLDPCNYTLWF